MQITVNRLKHVMALVAPAVSTRDTIPAITQVIFKEGFAVGNNLEIAIAVEVPELGDEVFMLPPKRTEQTLGFLPDNSQLEITVDSGQVTLKDQGGFTAHQPMGTPGDFPDFPVFDRTGGGEVDGDAFVKNIAELLPYASKEASRPALTGVCLTLGEVLEVAAADGNRLAWRTLDMNLASDDAERSKVVVPARTYRVLQQLWRRVDKRPRASSSFGVERLANSPALQVASLATAKRYIDVTLGASRISFQMGDATLVSNTIEGEFPDYRSIVPDSFTHSLVFDAGEAYRAVRQMRPIAAAGAGIIRLEWRGKVLTISAKHAEMGESQTAITATIKGRASRIAFNVKYLLEVLKDLDGPMLLETGAPTGPGRFTHHAAPNILVMSMAVRDDPKSDQEPEEPEPGAGDDSGEETLEETLEE